MYTGARISSIGFFDFTKTKPGGYVYPMSTGATAQRTLILNLTRFGDLLQTQPIIAGLAASGAKTGLVCLSHFAGAAELLRHLDYVSAFPDADILRGLDAHWGQSLAKLEQWRADVDEEFAPVRIINLTASLSSRILARLLTKDGVELTGFGLDSFGFGQNDDPWTAFLQASTRQRGCSPYNLADIFRKTARVDHVPPEYKLVAPAPQIRAAIQARLQAALQEAVGDAPCRGLAAFQLGASEDRRRWPIEYFADLGKQLWQECAYVPVLLGAKNELGLAERYAAMAETPFINFIGSTDLPGLAATLLETDLLLTNDTGTMHLAAGLNVPVLAIFLATAQPWDTGPYQENMCCLEPDLACHPCAFDAKCPYENKCRRQITPETVFSLAANWLGSKQWTWDKPDCNARIWQTVRHPAAEDPAQFIDLASLSGHEQTDQTQWLRIQRLLISRFLDQNHALSDLGTPPAFRLSPEIQAAVHSEIMSAVGLLHLMQEQGRAMLKRPIPALKTGFLSTWQRLQTLWDASRHFNMLGFLWLCETQALGDDLHAVLHLAGQYQQLLETWQKLLPEQSE